MAVGKPQPGGSFGEELPTFQAKFAPGKLTAKALASDGSTVLATHSVSSWGAAAAIDLTMDVPSASTGTGTAVVCDTQPVITHSFRFTEMCTLDFADWPMLRVLLVCGWDGRRAASCNHRRR